MDKGQTGFWGSTSQYLVGAPTTVPMPPVTNAVVPVTTSAGRYMTTVKGARPKTTPSVAAAGLTPPYGPVGYAPQQQLYGSTYMPPAYAPGYAPQYGYAPMPQYTLYPMPGQFVYPQQPQQPVPLWTSNMQAARASSLSASGSLLPPLPYTPNDREQLALGTDFEQLKSRKLPGTDEIEHCMIFGIPGIDDGIFTYRGNLENCTEVMNILHSGKFKVGYKKIRPRSTHGDSMTSLELLFAQSSLESIPESGIMSTDEEMEKEQWYLRQRLQELKNMKEVKQKIREEQEDIECKASTPKGLSDIWRASVNSLTKKEGKK